MEEGKEIKTVIINLSGWNHFPSAYLPDKERAMFISNISKSINVSRNNMDELHSLCSSPNIVRLMKYRGLLCSGDVAWIMRQ
jgi:hypothetical protein